MTRAFDYNGAATGVLTTGRSPASGACLSRSAEPPAYDVAEITALAGAAVIWQYLCLLP